MNSVVNSSSPVVARVRPGEREKVSFEVVRAERNAERTDDDGVEHRAELESSDTHGLSCGRRKEKGVSSVSSERGRTRTDDAPIMGFSSLASWNAAALEMSSSSVSLPFSIEPTDPAAVALLSSSIPWPPPLIVASASWRWMCPG